MKDYWKTFWSLLIIITYVALVFILSLYQFQASEPFSLDNIFSTENVIETAIVFIACIVLVVVVGVVNKKK